MATQETRAELIEIVVAMFDAAPGVAVLSDLVTASDAGNSNALIAASLANSAEFKGIFPTFQTNAEFVSKFVDQMVGSLVSDAEKTTVKNALTGEMNLGATRVDVVLTAVKALKAIPTTDTVWGNASAAFANKVEVATYHTVEKQQATTTLADLQGELAGVDNTAASVTDAKAELDGEAAAGETFTLTTGLDVASDFAAGAGNDTFVALDVDPTAGVADASTFTTGDSLDGGDGIDTLVIRASADAAANTNAASVSTVNIENLSIFNNSANDLYAVDASLMAGLTDVFINGGNATTTVSGLDSTPNLHLISTNEDASVAFADLTVGAGTADEVTILANRVATSSPVEATYDRVETINLVAAGTTGSLTATTDRSLTISAADLETLNVSGDADIYVTTTFSGADADTQTSTFDASAAGGKVTASLTKGTSDLVSITMSGQDDYLAYNSALSEDAIIDGGEGVDTLELGSSLSYGTTALTQTAGTGVSGFEVLRLAAGVTVDARAFVNNEGLTTVIAEGAGSYTKSGITSLTQLATGAFTASLATDGAADELAVTLGGAGAGIVSTLTAADMESIAFTSAGLGTNEIEMSATGSLDLTSVTVTGTTSAIVDVAGVSLATVDASGLSGLGRTFTLEASESEADMTVTGSEVVASDEEADEANIITTGEGDDTITTGDYNDTINAGDGDNTVVAGDGNNTVTTGKGDDTITAGDGDNTITTGRGDDTITTGNGKNTIVLDRGDNTVTTGSGADTITAGSGSDTISSGAGNDSIGMDSYDDDHVINGGAGTDTLSKVALATLSGGAQLQALTRFIDVTPGTSRTSAPQFTAVENVYMDANIALANDADDSTTTETIDFSASSGISNLFLNVTDGDVNENGTLTLSEVDAAAIHLSNAGAGDLAELVIVGAGQASLTLKGFDADGKTDITVSDVDAVTLTSYQSNALAAVDDTDFGDVEADDADTVTVTMASTTAALAGGTLTIGDLSADDATAIALNAGSNNTLALGDVTSESVSLETLTLTVSDDGTLTADDIESTEGELSSVAITLGVNSSLTVTAELDVADAAVGTITIGAASTLTMDDLIIGGAVTTITGTASSTVDIDTFGKTDVEGTYVLKGRGDLDDFAIDGETTLNLSQWTDVDAGTFTITSTTHEDATFVGNNVDTDITLGNGENTITTGSGDDVIDVGNGDNTISTGAGDDDITLGDGQNSVNVGAGANTITNVGATAATATTFDSVASFAVSSADAAVGVAAETGGIGQDIDLLEIDDSNDDLANADADASLSVGAAIAADTVNVGTADADGDLVAADITAVVADGILTIDGAAADVAVIDTLAEWYTVASLALDSYEDTVGTDAADVAEYAIAFEYDGSTYVVSATDGNGGDDLAMNDFIKLTGVTDVAGVELNGTTATAPDYILIG